MEYKSLDEIRQVAEVVPVASPKLSRRERLERWATLLLRDPNRWLTPLMRVEYLPEAERLAARSDNSPLTVAFQDPVLRENGLAGDRIGDGANFFELSSQQAHYLLCDCHYDGMMSAARVAERIGRVAEIER